MTPLPDQALSPALFSTIVDSSLNSLIVYEPVRQPALASDPGEIVDFTIRLANKAASELTGFSNEELINYSLCNRFPELARSDTFERYKQACLTGQRDRFETYFAYHTQTPARWFDVSVVPVGDQLVVSCLDISDAREQAIAQEKARQQLAQTAQMLQNILDSAHAGMALYRSVREPSPDGQTGAIVDFEFLAVNQMTIQLTGHPEASLVGNRLLTLFPHSIESGVFAHYVAVVETGQLQRFEIEYRADGMAGWYSVAVVKQDDGFIETFLDITATKQVQLAQQQQTDLLNSVLDGSSNGVLGFTAIRDADHQITDLRILVANQAAETITGTPVSTLSGSTLLTHFPGNVASGLFAKYVNTIETGEPTQLETYYQYDGLDFWLNISARKLGDGLVITFTDVTVLKRVQQQLETLVGALRESNEGLEQFAYVASHDLQEPLRKVQSFGEMLRIQYAAELGETGTELLTRMQAATTRMQTLIQDLLAYSRVATQPGIVGLVDLNQVIAEVLGDLETVSQAKHAVIEVADLPKIAGDALQFRQLFQNLLSNALKFTHPANAGIQPHVTVRCRLIAGQEARPEAGLPRDASYYEITVADNGIGFAEKYRDRIFGAFQRLHGRSQYPGTGVGLAIVKKVIDKYGGNIVANSQPGVGSTFTLYFPQSA